MKGKRCLYPRIGLLLLAKEFEHKYQSLKMSENHAIYIGFYAYAGLYHNHLEKILPQRCQVCNFA